MSTRELDCPLEADALREIERVLRGRLRAYGLSMAFIDRTVEDAVQKGWEEYLRARAGGEAIENPNGFVVRAGFYRAVDELRREGRRADGVILDALIDNGSGAAASTPSTDEIAIAYLQAEELREAVGQLSPEEQQVLTLHYFEELTDEASAATMFCSERTYRRRLRKTLKKLGEILGAPVPEPDSELAIEIGVISWIALRGAQVALSHGPLDQLVGLAEGVHDRLTWLVDRARDVVGRTTGSGSSERVVALASSGPGKAVGTCLAACLLAVGGAELAGVGGGGVSHHADPPAAPRHVAARPSEHKPQLVTAPPVPVPPSSAASSTKSSRSSGAGGGSATRADERKRAATASVRSQSLESAAPSEETASEPAPEASAPSSSSEPTPNEVAGSQGLESLAP
ncbi:MAG: RNA polymerase sigma factor [Solirubrobacterales bacterium]